jgi:predicted tellurium resistance membrane protein TerC
MLRILYITGVKTWSHFPYINIATGLIMFIFAIRMVMPKKSMRRHFSLLWIFSSIAALDLIMSVDSILLSARLSDNVAFIAMGVLPALLLLFFFSSRMEEFFAKMPWIEVAIAGLLAQLAVLQIKKEPGILQLLQEEWFDLMGIIAMCVVCSVGWYNLWKKAF